MQVFVRFGRIHVIDIDPNVQTGEIWRRILGKDAHIDGYLLFQGKVLNEELTLAENGIEAEDTVHCMLRLRGGKSIGDAFKKVGDVFTGSGSGSISGAVSSGTDQVFDKIKEFIQDAVNSAQNAIMNALNVVLEELKAIGKTLADEFDKIRRFFQFFSDCFDVLGSNFAVLGDFLACGGEKIKNLFVKPCLFFYLIDLVWVLFKVVVLVFILLIGAIFQIKALTDLTFEDMNRALRDANTVIHDSAGFRIGWPKNIYDDCYNCQMFKFKPFPKFSDSKYQPAKKSGPQPRGGSSIAKPVLIGSKPGGGSSIAKPFLIGSKPGLPPAAAKPGSKPGTGGARPPITAKKSSA